MKTRFLALLAFIVTGNVHSYSSFVSNPYTPYPPGCATLPDLQSTLHGDNIVRFFEQEIPLDVPSNPVEQVNANVAAYRVACADASRSVIWLEFSIPEDVNGEQFYLTPEVRAVIGESAFYGVSLVREPNGWDVGIRPWEYAQVFGGGGDLEDGHGLKWVFVLDNASWFTEYFEPQQALSAAQYNGSFTLELNWRDHAGWDIPVPSTASLFASNPRIPLSGRLSGNWVVDGASDQGFVISISELVPGSAPRASSELLGLPLLMFLSWFTFDQNGDQLWLTGAAQFEMGATEVTVPIESVIHGEFLGDKAAERTTIGSVTITGNSCNDLTLDYDLDMYGIGTGLGSGTKRLQRLFSLETAGYVCRDLEARMDAESSTAASPPAPPSPAAIDVENLSLAFVRGGTIFASALDGSEPIELLQEGTQPAWSSDGTRLAFTRPMDNSLANWQLCIAQANGTDIRCATGETDGHVVGVPTWSPDGSTVAFSVFVYCSGGACNNGGYFTSLSLLDTRTMQVSVLDTPPVWSASWSPDGRKIAIAMFGVGNYGRGALGVVNTDGSGLEILANSIGSYSVNQVAWSPDGGRLALTLWDEHACPWYCDMAIGVVNADGTQLKVLDRARTSDDVYFWTPPAWSPDGVSLVYTVSRGDSCYLHHVACNEIAVVDVASGPVGRLLSPGAYPSWRP